MLWLMYLINDIAYSVNNTLSLHDALPICEKRTCRRREHADGNGDAGKSAGENQEKIDRSRFRTLVADATRSEEHTSELQSPDHLVCRLLLEKKNTHTQTNKRRLLPTDSNN